MAPFLRYTEKSQAGGESNDKLVFLNADYISKATWSERNRSLEIIYSVPEGKQQHSTARLEGDEAADAMKVLMKLK